MDMSAERLTSAIASVLSIMLRILSGAMLTAAERISRIASIRPEALVTARTSVAVLSNGVGRVPPWVIMRRCSRDLAAHDSHGHQQDEYPAVEM